MLNEIVSRPGTIIMFTTLIDGLLSTRPLTCVQISGNRLSFLVDATTPWAVEIERHNAQVHASMGDDHHSRYASLNGSAAIDRDPEERQRLWNAAAMVWFDGPDDPSLAVLHLEVHNGQWWDGPSGRIGRAMALIAGIVTQSDSPLGTEGALTTPASITAQR